MKIKTKLALLYTSITVSVLVVVFVFVYFLTSKTIDNNYYTLLFDKVLLTAQKNFEEDELSQVAYQKILDTYQSLMPEALERIIVANDKQEAIIELQTFLDNNQIEKIFKEEYVKFEIGNMDGVGIYYPDNEGDFIVVVTAENTQGKYIKATLKNILFAVLLISSIFIFGLLWWNAQIITKPLQLMVEHMQKITAKDLHLRLPERKGDDELSQTTNYFNQMIERLEISFNSQKTFIANASHELKNPLTAIMGECEVMQLKDFTTNEYKDSIKQVEYEAERLNSLVNNLLQLVQTDLDMSESNKEKLVVGEEILAAINYFESSKYRGRILFENDNSTYSVEANKHLFFVALQNIIDNACKYSEKQVVVKTDKIKSGFQIAVIDEGIGIPSSEKDKIFDTFYRAGNTSSYKGSGIGLSLAFKILKLSGADIDVESFENKGTTVLISWNNRVNERILQNQLIRHYMQ